MEPFPTPSELLLSAYLDFKLSKLNKHAVCTNVLHHLLLLHYYLNLKQFIANSRAWKFELKKKENEKLKTELKRTKQEIRDFLKLKCAYVVFIGGSSAPYV